MGLQERAGELEVIVARFQETVANKDEVIAAQGERIKELEDALAEP